MSLPSRLPFREEERDFELLLLLVFRGSLQTPPSLISERCDKGCHRPCQGCGSSCSTALPLEMPIRATLASLVTPFKGTHLRGLSPGMTLNSPRFRVLGGWDEPLKCPACSCTFCTVLLGKLHQRPCRQYFYRENVNLWLLTLSDFSIWNNFAQGVHRMGLLSGAAKCFAGKMNIISHSRCCAVDILGTDVLISAAAIQTKWQILPPIMLCIFGSSQNHFRGAPGSEQGWLHAASKSHNHRTTEWLGGEGCYSPHSPNPCWSPLIRWGWEMIYYRIRQLRHRVVAGTASLSHLSPHIPLSRLIVLCKYKQLRKGSRSLPKYFA